MKQVSIAFITVSLAGLTACGGGGGGSSTLSAFTNWSSVSPGSSITISGDSLQGTYTYDLATERVTGLTAGSQQAGAAYAAVYDAGGVLSSATINSAEGTSISWSAAAGDTFGYLISDPRISVAASANGQNYVLAADPFDFGFEYQSFGTWVTGAGTGSGTFGLISVGSQSSGSAIPTAGTATYTGVSGGRYIDSTGIDYFISSSLSVTADFTARNLLFSTNGTAITRDLISSSSATNLNLTGSLSYTAGSATFSGSLSTTGLGTRGNPLQGQAYGRFYGPSAQEIGGTFAVSSGFSEGAADKEIYGGSFGAKR